jgi:hypothetical protein
MPNGPWPNAPSDQCLPVSILVPRNAPVLTIQFHLPDKADYRTFEVALNLSGLCVNQDLFVFQRDQRVYADRSPRG